jgi:S-adenosylmethionine decarboxylase proenzyme
MSSGKHLICDIKNIQNELLIHDLDGLRNLLDSICKKYEFNILNKVHHEFTPQGITLLYLLSESHISIHTFPEKKYIAMDVYTCKEYSDNSVYIKIWEEVVDAFKSTGGKYIIIDRDFT